MKNNYIFKWTRIRPVFIPDLKYLKKNVKPKNVKFQKSYIMMMIKNKFRLQFNDL